MEKRYTLIDNKKSKKFTYHKWELELAFALIFIAGIGISLLFCNYYI